MRVIGISPRVRHRFVGDVPGILVEGTPIVGNEGVSISNFFVPFIGCVIITYEVPTPNGDQFTVSNQVGIYRTDEGELFFGPNSDYNDFVLCFVEFKDSEGIVLPKHKAPEFVKKLEFDDNTLYIVILKKNCKSSIIVFSNRDTICEHEFYYNYEDSFVEHKFKPLKDD